MFLSMLCTSINKIKRNLYAHVSAFLSVEQAYCCTIKTALQFSMRIEIRRGPVNHIAETDMAHGTCILRLAEHSSK